MRRLLIIAYHFPPCAGSSGLLRSEKFARYLPEFGWETSILTVHPRAYESVDSHYKEMGQAPVVRAFALDTKKHLSFRGAYLDWMALPDRWLSWVFGAIPSGLRMIEVQGRSDFFHLPYRDRDFDRPYSPSFDRQTLGRRSPRLNDRRQLSERSAD